MSATVLIVVVSLLVGAWGSVEVVGFILKITGFKVVDLVMKAAGLELVMDLVEEITLVVVIAVVIGVEGL